MSDTVDQILAKAFDLIEADEPTEAVALLKPILEQDESNVDAWWLYAHAVSDPETARMALNQVLKLDESYVEAQDMLAELDSHYPMVSQSETPPPPVLPEESATPEDMQEIAELDELESDETLFNLADDDEPVFSDREMSDAATAQTQPNRLPIVLIALLIIIAVIIALVAVINPFGSSPQLTPTSVAQQVVDDTVTPDTDGEISTNLPPTTTQSASPDNPATAVDVSTAPAEIEPVVGTSIDTVSEALASFELAPDSIGTIETSLNDTFVAGVCSSANRAQLQEVLEGSLIALASISETVTEDVEAIGIALIDCENDNQVRRVIGVPIEAAIAFATESIDASEFQALWQAIA